jgi:hypothetical protein
MNVKTIAKEHMQQIINLVFKKDYEKYELKISNETHYYFYHITKIELLEKQSKNTKKENSIQIKKENANDSKKEKIQTNQTSNNKRRQEPNSFN